MKYKLIVNGQESEVEIIPEMTLGEMAQIAITQEGYKIPLERWSVKTPTGIHLEKEHPAELFAPPLFISLNPGVGA